MITTKTEEQIDELFERVQEYHEHGTRYRGMTYEQGIEDAICWLTDQGWDEPTDWPFAEE